MWTTLHDIAYLYLFLAADIDGMLAEAEVEAIAELLQKRTPGRSAEAIQTVVKEANTARLGKDGRGVRDIVESLKYASFTDAQRGVLLDDLMQIARADGTVLAAEERFISVLARAWDVDLPDDMGGAVHDLALVYLFMAMGRDGTLTREYRTLVADQLSHWQPDLTTDTLQMIVKNAAQALQQGNDTYQLEHAVDVIKQALPLAPQRRAVLYAVMEIAQADGALTDDELAFFQHLADALDVPPKT